MLDVAIGLVMVFAVVSLIASVIQESISSAFNRRGKNLRQAISSLLADNTQLADEFLSQPLVRTMMLTEQKTGDSATNRMPSYLSPETFGRSLIEFLVQKAALSTRGATPGEFMAHMNGGTIDAKLLGTLQTLLRGTETDWPAFEARLQAWFSDVAERSTGWYKRSTQTSLMRIGLAIAIVFNIDAISIMSALWSDRALRELTVKTAVQVNDAFVTGKTAADNASTSKGRTQSSAETGKSTNLSEVSPGADGLRRPGSDQSRKVETLLAEMQKQVIAISTKASPDDKSVDVGRETARLSALGAVLSIKTSIDEHRAPSDGSILAQRRQASADANFAQHLENLRLSLGKLKTQINITGSDALPQLEAAWKAEKDGHKGEDQNALRDCAGIADAQERNMCLAVHAFQSVSELSLPIGWGRPLPNLGTTPCARGSNAQATGQALAAPNANASKKDEPGLFCIRESSPQTPIHWAAMLAGWLITAFAVSLGANFWFDLLGKLIKIRAAGKPLEGTDAKPNAPAASTPANAAQGTSTQPEASSDAINDFEREFIKDETRVRQLQKLIDMPADQISGRLDLATREAIKARQKLLNLVQNGELDQALVDRIFGNTAAAAVPIAPAQSDTDTEFLG
ncbi:MAG: hypothetical protein KF778_02990 [Rhodocyclaceae bacterium]|nr:hypothetical protein [Rhodocyclaceae bacterium]MBX3667343.1 hypothetical protein [Rhodocyclaceae bacterium]